MKCWLGLKTLVFFRFDLYFNILQPEHTSSEPENNIFAACRAHQVLYKTGRSTMDRSDPSFFCVDQENKVCSTGKKKGILAITQETVSSSDLYTMFGTLWGVGSCYLWVARVALCIWTETQKNHWHFLSASCTPIYLCMPIKMRKNYTMHFMCITCAGEKLDEYHSDCDGNKKQSPKTETIRPSSNWCYIVKASNPSICWILIYCLGFLLMLLEYAFHIYPKEKGDANLRNYKLPFSQSLILWSLWCYVFLILPEFKTQGNLRSLPIIETRCLAWFLLFSENCNQRIPIQGR